MAQIKIGAILSYISIGINILAGLVITPWIIAAIGRSDFGLYTLAMSIISLFVFDFGLSSAVTRFISKYLAERNQDKANVFLALTFKIYVILDIVLIFVLTIVFFLIPQIYKELSPAEIVKFEIIYILAALFSVLSFPFIPANGVLSAHEKFIQIKLCDIAQKIIMVSSMGICLWLGYGLYALVLVNIISGLCAIVLKVFCINRFTPQRMTKTAFDRNEFKNIVSFSSWVTVIALAQRCIFNLAPSVLGVLSGSDSIAILGIALTIEGYTFTFANALNGMFLPRVTKIISENNGNILPFMIKIGRIQLYIIALIVFGVLCFGKQFIQLWVGNAFSESYLCAILIIFPALLHLPQDIGLQALYAKNEVKRLSYIYVVMAALNILLAVILTPKLEALGICLSICIAYIIRTIGMDILFKRQINIDVISFFRGSYVKILPWVFLVVLIGFGLNQISLFEGPLGLAFKVSTFIAIYFSIMYLFSMTKEEKHLFLSPISKLLHRK